MKFFAVHWLSNRPVGDLGDVRGNSVVPIDESDGATFFEQLEKALKEEFGLEAYGDDVRIFDVDYLVETDDLGYPLTGAVTCDAGRLNVTDERPARRRYRAFFVTNYSLPELELTNRPELPFRGKLVVEIDDFAQTEEEVNQAVTEALMAHFDMQEAKGDGLLHIEFTESPVLL